jgi:pimeloyl-ACP methyl ester carboxylesterase
MSDSPIVRDIRRRLLLIAAAAVLLVTVGPFLIPVPPLEDTVPPARLAAPDSRFMEVNGIDVHFKEMGTGDRTFILLHGFGASVFSWREVMTPLAMYGRVIAYDRPAFGLTERPLRWSGDSPYGAKAQVELLFALMDALHVGRAVLVGHSAGGTIALAAALGRPDRVAALVLVDAAVYTTGGGPAWLRALLATPQLRHIGPLLVRRIAMEGDSVIRTAWHDPSAITQAVYDGYHTPLRAQDRDRALWELAAADAAPDLPSRLGTVKLPTLIVTGDDDRIVPTADSLRLAKDIPAAQLAVVPACGHLPQEERPQAFLNAVTAFVAR